MQQKDLWGRAARREQSRRAIYLGSSIFLRPLAGEVIVWLSLPAGKLL
jgi:hypothetical protein